MKEIGLSFFLPEEQKAVRDDNWEDVREALRIKIEHIVMSYPNSDIFYECQKCHHRVIHQTQKPFFIESLVDFVIKEMNGNLNRLRQYVAQGNLKERFEEMQNKLKENNDGKKEEKDA